MTDKIVNKKWENWENISPDKWERYAPPFRPSLGDVKNYEEALGEITKKSKILILGSTPEIRDIADKMNTDVIVADFSLSMMENMLKFAKRASASREKWIKADWLFLDEFLKNNYFDMILGDLVLRLVEAKQEEEFLDKIKIILSSKGIFITRVHFINESWFESTAEEILNKSINISDEGLVANIITGRIFDKFSDSANKIFYRKEAIEFMQKASNMAINSREKMIFLKVLDFVRGGMGWPITRGETKWSINSKIQLENLFGKFFDVVDVKIAADYPDSEFYPIYTLKKKTSENI